MTLVVMTTDLMIGKCLSFYGLTNFMLKWIWRDSEENYDDFYLWDIQVNAEYFSRSLIAAI